MKILFVSYGTGGAEAINPIYLKFKEMRYNVENVSISKYTSGKLSDVINIEESNIYKYILLNKTDVVFNERSNGLQIQNNITNFCIDHNILNISILDMYGNYNQRFKYIPNFIFVPSTEIKKELIESGYNKDIIKTTGNPAFDVFPNLTKKRKFDNLDILYVSQPLLELNAYIKNQYNIFDDYYNLINKNIMKFRIHVKLHPQENISKWNNFIKIYQHTEIIKEDYDIFFNFINQYDLVIGYDSTLMLKTSYMNLPTIYYKNYEREFYNYINGKDLEKSNYNFSKNAVGNIIKEFLKIVKKNKIKE